jgi:hypothetical protein
MVGERSSRLLGPALRQTAEHTGNRESSHLNQPVALLQHRHQPWCSFPSLAISPLLSLLPQLPPPPPLAPPAKRNETKRNGTLQQQPQLGASRSHGRRLVQARGEAWYNLTLSTELQPRYPVLTLLGVVLLLTAPRLATSASAFYAGGVTLSFIALSLVILYQVSRKLPGGKKLGGTSP